MRIVYIDFIRFPTEKAHGYQIAKTAEALTETSMTTLVFPDRINEIKTTSEEYFDLKNKLDIKYLKIFDPFKYFSIANGKIFTILLYLWRLLFIFISYFSTS